jgi:NADH-quinone oxidoreductase subunit N
LTPAELVALLPALILVMGSVTLLMIGAFRPGRGFLLGAGIVVAMAAAVCAGLYSPPVAEIGNLYGTSPYARFFTILWSLATALTLLLSFRYGEERGFGGGEYVSLLLFAAAGMSLVSSATSLVGFFVALEAFTLALYILIAFNLKGAQGAEAGLKYLILGATSTGFLAFGIALIYTAAGTFHLPEAMVAIAAGSVMRPLGLLGWSMVLVMVGFKVSLVPFHLWTPDVYQGAPAPITGILSTASKGAVFAALVPLLAEVGSGRLALAPLLWTLSALSMLVGTFCALRQENIKRMLAYSSIVHMGYILMAVLAGGKSGNSAAVFYVVVYAAVNLGAFGVITSFADGKREFQVYNDYRNAAVHYPFRCSAMAVFLFALAGVPPTAGFMGKLFIFSAAVRADYVVLAVLGVLASIISLYYYLRVAVVMFMSETETHVLSPGSANEHAVLAFCMIVVLWLGIFPGTLFNLISGFVP